MQTALLDYSLIRCSVCTVGKGEYTAMCTCSSKLYPLNHIKEMKMQFSPAYSLVLVIQYKHVQSDTFKLMQMFLHLVA